MRTKLFYPNKELWADAAINSMDEYHRLQDFAKNDYEGFWDSFAKEKITWRKPYTKVLDDSNMPFVRWFEGGELNVSEQCIDRHLNDKADKIAIIFQGEKGDIQKITYKQLSIHVNKTANLLRDHFGITKGDRIVMYMPMIPEAAYVMLACARIGAIHSIVFGGFSADAIHSRVLDAKAKLIITADGAFRRGKPYFLKPTVDEALAKGECDFVEKVLVVKRNYEDINMVAGRDEIYNDLIDTMSDKCEAEIMQSEDPLFLLYTSGSTGKPKGVLHSQAGYILWAQMTMEWVFDIKDSDIYWCTADVGWITGHTYIIYGPLASGATTVMFEGVPTYPDAGRWWKMVEELKITQFYTSPTAIRMLHKVGDNEPDNYDLSSLRILGSVGEPINPEAWEWYYNKVGRGNCPIVDTWWQTETGGHMISPLPGATPIQTSCATLPVPGIMAEVMDKDGTPTAIGEKGLLCITRPWPAMIRGVWGDDERFKKAYFGECKKDGKPVYFSGDGAMVDEKGYITITGRTDDVINVSGHRIGSAEVEASIGNAPMVAESAVVGQPHPIKGESLCAFIILNLKEHAGYEEMALEINSIIKKEIGAFAKCDRFIFVPGLPKTRSGKIMRRLLRSISVGEEIIQDISTLEDPSVVEEIIKATKEQS
ncbi:acetyl-CoA synthetase [Sulfurimonas gotlandica GD1]|uniref:Acetate--CoA ligase n=1 Tax=Sulfurimonas gotlandica (strain DSM 19862 / JCM 16533 / GD1) TaxID=929558 RepID=B6BKP7_SULGG|nr:acetate--CoA ligase [Sulfurimonas gotlandica]EDZ62252.1 acetate--CoA ligase [Sulfurimonas gotlandica GD1]EHP29106.1 acetyl-CoA synthetase [Sulfurimonas gotlandica GD1]